MQAHISGECTLVLEAHFTFAYADSTDERSTDFALLPRRLLVTPALEEHSLLAAAFQRVPSSGVCIGRCSVCELW